MENLFMAFVEVVNPITNKIQILDCNKMTGDYEQMCDVVDRMVAGCNRCGMKVLRKGVIEMD